MTYFKSFLAVGAVLAFISFAFMQSNQADYDHSKNPYYSHTDQASVKVDNALLKKILPPIVYHIAREQGTEQSYTGKYWDNHAKGTYYCAICGNPLYTSDTKFESGTGWPSFYQALNTNSVYIAKDADGDRDEVECKRCHSHLGHVFDDGPKPTGKRFCMDGDVLDFIPAK